MRKEELEKLIKKYFILSESSNIEKINDIRNQILEYIYYENVSPENRVLVNKINKKVFNKVELKNLKKSYKLLYFDEKYYLYKEKEKSILKKINKSPSIALLKKLKKVRNDYAVENGYKSYYEFSYIEGNKYNYNHKDILKLRDLTKKYLCKYNNNDKNEYKYSSNIIKGIKKYVNKNIYNFEKLNINEIKSNNGWKLIYHPSNNSFDLYTSFKNTYKDIINYAHELGHIYQLSNTNIFIDRVFNNYDVSEMFSSYFELLCTKYINDKDLIKIHLRNIINIITSSVMTDEFNEIFYSKNLSDIELENEYIKLCDTYGIIKKKKVYEDLKRINHPEHSIDYAIAYIASIYSFNTISVDKYKKMQMDSMKYDYKDFIKENNLGNAFKEHTFKKIKEIINEN